MDVYFYGVVRLRGGFDDDNDGDNNDNDNNDYNMIDNDHNILYTFIYMNLLKFN